MTRFSLRASLLALVAVFLGGCAAQSVASSAKSCEPVPQSMWTSGQEVFRDCAVDRKARQVSAEPRLSYSGSVATRGATQGCLRATVEVVADSSGRLVPATARVVSTNDQELAQALLASLPVRRYEPAVKDKVRVPQLVNVETKVAFLVRTVVVPAGQSPGTAAPPRAPRTPPC